MLQNFSEIADVILLLEKEMRDRGLWETQSPEPRQLSSTLPFCCDTLSFLQWIQWIFIPRVKFYVENNRAFPFNAQIFPYAEEVCKQLPYDVSSVLKIIADFDRIVSSHDVRS